MATTRIRVPGTLVPTGGLFGPVPTCRSGVVTRQREPPRPRSAFAVVDREGVRPPLVDLPQQRHRVVRRHQFDAGAWTHGLQRTEDGGVPDGMRDGAGVQLRVPVAIPLAAGTGVVAAT